MASISLPEIPKGKEFEEFVAALFQSKGYYIDRNVVLRKIEEILEIDCLITDYKSLYPIPRLIEVKSGDWRFPDLFKIRGWIDYLNTKKGILVVQKTKENIDFFKNEACSLGIDLVVIDNLQKAPVNLAQYFSESKIDENDIETWRYAYWVERVILKRLKQKKRFNQNMICFQKLDEYLDKVNNSTFFTRNLLTRIDNLYDAFREYPHISAKCANELIGNSFDDSIDKIPQELYKETFYDCKYNDIQVSLFIEHRARLAILKNAIDYTLLKKAKIESEETRDKIEFLGEEDLSLFNILPDSFRQGLDCIGNDRYFYLYPIFWQWFAWVFGGFILLDYKKEDYNLLSQKTSIPIDEIDSAFASYGKLFHQDDDWFIDLKDSRIRIMKMFPMPFAGIGANYRRIKYTDNYKFENLKLSGKHTLDDIIHWNNLVVDVLRSDLQ